MVYVTPFLAPLEILRRASWMFFRVEHQQFQNLDQYANMNWVPLHFSPKPETGADARRMVGREVLRAAGTGGQPRALDRERPESERMKK